MKKQKDISELIETSKSKLITIEVILTFIFLAISLLFRSYKLYNTLFLQIISVTISSVTLYIINAIRKQYDGELLKYLRNLFILISIYLMLTIVKSETKELLLATYIIKDNDFYLNGIYIVILTQISYSIMISIYIKENIKKVLGTISFYISLIFILLINFKIINVHCNVIFLLVNGLIILGSIYVFILSSVDLSKKNNKINLFNYWTLLSLIIAILSIINQFVDFKLVLQLNKIFVFLWFTSVGILSLDRILESPFKILFKDTYLKNMEMNNLNRKIIESNRQLEKSQNMIANKDKMFKELFKNIPIPLVIIDSNSKRINYANSEFLDLVEEKNLKNIINKKFDKYIEIENIPSFDKVKDKNKIISGKVKGDSSVKIVDFEVIKSVDKEDSQIIIFEDTTTKRENEEIEQDMKDKKFQEKIKRDFLSNISHDLKTPINVIFSASQLQEYYIDEINYEGIEKYNSISRQNCLSLIKFTNNLIDNSKILSDYLSPNLVEKNVVEEVEEIVMSLVDYAKNKDIDLIFDTEDEEVYAEIDVEFMQRIILNLISNSMKFCKEDGRIIVRIINNNEEVIIEIEDNGIGMEKEFVENAFNRYAMGKNNARSREKGTGIGLFVVKKMVEMQNGSIKIDSVINKGTKISLTFKKVIKFEI